MQSMEVTAISSIEHILAWIGLVLVISQIKKVLLRVLSAKDGGTIVGQEFTHPDTSGHPLATSSVFQQPSLEISVVIPVQPGTGKLRLQGLLNEAVDSLKLNVSNQLWEIVLVGPPGEELTVVGKSFLQMLGYEHIRLLILPSHSLDASGFAGILRRGVLVSRGKFILTCDTSGSVRFSDFVELERTRAAFSAEVREIPFALHFEAEELDCVHRYRSPWSERVLSARLICLADLNFRLLSFLDLNLVAGGPRGRV
uniref:Uncharacterized protein n=1 Tax=Rhodosorus marinus TaxID=101924 RepID=A0A7S3EBX0_9RHOD|mmetsp:Transcript_23870/g.93863  ORF Transcript_23870/g.93863 Transcript_23870/m.93863 type:complete len:255 (+) Transcript_23870:349-1113(+)